MTRAKGGFRIGSYAFNSNVHFSKGQDGNYADQIFGPSPDDGKRWPVNARRARAQAAGRGSAETFRR
jgi:hypothetical protein